MDHSSTLDNSNIKVSRLFLGADGHLWLSDRFGTHRASALAIAMLQKPGHRAAGYREDGYNA